MSLKDLSKLGKSILRQELLSEAQSRRWLKPKSLLNDNSKAVGMPWEIERTQVGSRTVDLYTKDGDWNVYHTRLILVPDYQVGVTILTASDSAAVKPKGGIRVVGIGAEALIAKVVPALEASAKMRAEKAFAGTYVSHAGSTQHSLVIAADAHPGLKVVAWKYNGTDILAELGRALAADGKQLDFRLEPNGLYQGNRVGFTGVTGSGSWETVDLFKYGNIGLEQFAFEVGGDGVAGKVEALALRDTLKRV